MRHAEIMGGKVAKSKGDCNTWGKAFLYITVFNLETPLTCFIKSPIKNLLAFFKFNPLVLKGFHNLREEYLTLNCVHSLGKYDYIHFLSVLVNCDLNRSIWFQWGKLSIQKNFLKCINTVKKYFSEACLCNLTIYLAFLYSIALCELFCCSVNISQSVIFGLPSETVISLMKLIMAGIYFLHSP